MCLAKYSQKSHRCASCCWWSQQGGRSVAEDRPRRSSLHARTRTLAASRVQYSIYVLTDGNDCSSTSCTYQTASFSHADDACCATTTAEVHPRGSSLDLNELRTSPGNRPHQKSSSMPMNKPFWPKSTKKKKFFFRNKVDIPTILDHRLFRKHFGGKNMSLYGGT